MPPENDLFDTPVRPKREAAIKNTAVKKKPKKKKVNAASIIKEVLKLVPIRLDPEQMIDQVDWYAVLEAPLVEIVKCIRCRGMHWMLARRIKTILKRVMVQRGYLAGILRKNAGGTADGIFSRSMVWASRRRHASYCSLCTAPTFPST